MPKATVREATDKLAALGGADQIALFFEQEGITGFLQEANRCPVALYLERETNAPVIVCHTHIETLRSCVLFQRPVDGRWMPQYLGIAQFIKRFDQRQYPALIRPSNGDPIQ